MAGGTSSSKLAWDSLLAIFAIIMISLDVRFEFESCLGGSFKRRVKSEYNAHDVVIIFLQL